MTDLLPCPFCGDEAEDYDSDFGNGIYCMGCGAMVGEPIHLDYRVDERITYEQAASAWNTRAERTCHDTAPEGAEWFMCSECEKGTYEVYEYDYCPNCGAKVVE